MLKINDELKDVNGGNGSDYHLTLYGEELDMNMTIGQFAAKYPELKPTIEEKLNENNASLSFFSNYTLKMACFFIGTSELQAMINDAVANVNEKK